MTKQAAANSVPTEEMKAMDKTTAERVKDSM